MSKKPVLRLILLLALVLPLLAACAPAEPQVVEKVVTQVVEQPAADKTVIRIAYNGYFQKTFGPADPPLDVIRREVAKVNPNIQVELNLMPYEAGPWHDSYLTWFNAQDGTVDLLGVGLYWLPEFAAADYLLPLNGLIDQEIIDAQMPAYVDAFTYDGTLWELGPWWGGIGGLYYRKDLLEAAGIEPPKTYDELVAAAKQLMAENPNMAGWTWPARKEQVVVNRWIEYLSGFGGTYFDDQGKCVMNNEKGLAALTFMKSLFDEGITPKEALSWKEEESQVRFASGEAIFHSGRQDLAFWLNDETQSKVKDLWAFIPNPAQPDGKSAGFFEGWGFGINKYSQHPEEAAQVLEVMFSFPVQKDFNLSQGPVQAHKDVYTDPDVLANNPYMEAINEVATTAMAPIPSPKFPEISDILQEELHSALSGIKEPQMALDDACVRIDEAIGQ